MLEVGNGGMTKDEYIVHFSIWAISKVLWRLLFFRSYMLCLNTKAPSFVFVIVSMYLVACFVHAILGSSSYWM